MRFRRRRADRPWADGDVHVRSIEGDVRPLAGFGTPAGDRLVDAIRKQTIERLDRRKEEDER